MAMRLLLGDNIKSWFRARGFWIVLLAALVPPALTGAWVWTHQDDVEATAIAFDPQEVTAGELVNISAVVTNRFDHATGPFNATLRVGYYDESFTGEVRYVERQSETFTLALGPQGSDTVAMQWTTEPGTFLAELFVDTGDALAEIEERNNYILQQVNVRFQDIQVPVQPAVTAGEGAPQADLAVLAVAFEDVYQDDDANVTVTVRNDGPDAIQNVTVRMQVHRATAGGYSATPSPDRSQVIDLGVGETRDVLFTWSATTIGQYAIVGSVDLGTSGTDPDTSDNARIQETFVDRRVLFEAPEAKATAKDFYRDVLSVLHLTLLVPLIALFYAAGVLEDEKDKGNLPYMLTRPVPRWMLPVARFLVSFVVAGAALAIGVIATFLLLLGQPQEAPGFLTWPLLYVLVALFAYSGLWSLAGVTVRRPYLLGLVYILGLEAVIVLGRGILVNGEPLLQDWILWFSLNHWMHEAFAGWDPAAPWSMLPGGDALRGLLIVLAVGVVGLAGSAWWMTRREFEV